MSRPVRTALGIVGAVLVLFLLIQVVPVTGRTNPPIGTQVLWSSPEAETLARAACLDCHSNETVWPWYSYIAPISWLTVHDVQEGRGKLNLSEAGAGQIELDEVVEQIRRGSMPPAYYTVMHPAAGLSDQQKQTLIAGFEATFGADAPVSGLTAQGEGPNQDQVDDDENGGD